MLTHASAEWAADQHSADRAALVEGIAKESLAIVEDLMDAVAMIADHVYCDGIPDQPAFALSLRLDSSVVRGYSKTRPIFQLREDSLMRAALLLLVPLPVLAAPIPKETPEQKLAALFGTPVDPNKDCEFDFDGKKLTIKVGKGDHALHASSNRAGAPRTLRTVEGDFTVEVAAAAGQRPPGAKPAMAGRGLTFHSQGLLLWVDDGTYVRLEHAHVNRLNGMVFTYVNWELFKGGEWIRVGVTTDGLLDDSKPTWFRLSRKGNEIRGAWSQDNGKTWNELEALTLELKAKAQVGVIVNHNTDSAFTAVFEGFKLTPAAPAK